MLLASRGRALLVAVDDENARGKRWWEDKTKAGLPLPVKECVVEKGGVRECVCGVPVGVGVRNRAEIEHTRLSPGKRSIDLTLYDPYTHTHTSTGTIARRSRRAAWLEVRLLRCWWCLESSSSL